MGGVALALADVDLRRGARPILRVPSLAIAAGEAVAIVGPNGAGKSTLLAILAGLEPLARGVARVGEAPATALEARRRVALMPQDAPLLEGTVARNVERPLALRGVGARERRARVAALLERMGLSALAARPGKALSGGEARRVALARALAAGPEALLLDEPFNGVDDPARELLVAEIRAGARASGRTLGLVTQRRDEALRLATRLIVLWGGEIRQDGPIEEVLSRPVDTEVARFLGLDNVLRARVVGHDADGPIVDALGVTLHVALPEQRPPLGPDVWVVFGPEQVELRAPASAGPSAPSSPRNVVRAKVVSVLPREGRVAVTLAAGFAGGLRIVAAVTRAAVEELALAPGAEVNAVVKATALHVLSI
jgi:molybdopterin-binding protein